MQQYAFGIFSIYLLPHSVIYKTLKRDISKYGKYGFTSSFFASVFYQIVLAMSRKMMTVCA